MKRISDVAGMPRAPLTLRFGLELGRRIDQAMGREYEIIDPVASPELIEVSRAFAEPIGAAETIERYTRILIEKLCGALEEASLGARRLDLLFIRVDNRIESICIGTARPDRDVKRLSRLICAKIETVDPGFGIEKMRLVASHAEALEMKQVRTSFGEDEPVDVTGLVDILTNRFGPDTTYRLEPFPIRVPERSVQRIPATAPPTGKRWKRKWPRPCRLDMKPQRIETMAVLPDYPPATFKWNGRRHRVKCADGPERVYGEWWMDDREVDAVRDYFRVEDDAGKRFWIFRAGDGEHTDSGPGSWWLHGIFG
jgi:protein ImuB